MSITSQTKRRLARRGGTWIRGSAAAAAEDREKSEPQLLPFYPNLRPAFVHPGDGQRGVQKVRPC